MTKNGMRVYTGRNAPIILTILCLGLLALFAAGCDGLQGRSASNQTEQPPKGSIELSKDQREIVDELGYPPSFTVYLDRVDGKPIRKEAWRYHGVGSTFMFSNGVFETVRSDLSPAPAGAKSPTVRPNQFGPRVNRADVTALVGEPQAEAKIDPNLFKGGKIYQFTGGVSVGMIGDRVVYVEASLYKPNSKQSSEGGGAQ